MKDFIMKPASAMSLAKRKLICGVGINDADYITVYKDDAGKKVICPFYSKWKNMLKRCYDPKYHATHPTYIGCTVHEEWLRFSNFRKWMEKQDWQRNQLDKDLLVPNNRVYSAESCLFVSSAVNNLTIDSAATRGEYPIGVYYNKHDGKYKASCSVRGKLQYIGYYDTVEAASAAYQDYKRQLIIITAREQTDIRIMKALLNMIDIHIKL